MGEWIKEVTRYISYQQIDNHNISLPRNLYKQLATLNFYNHLLILHMNKIAIASGFWLYDINFSEYIAS